MVEREFINEVYKSAFNIDLGISNLDNVDIIGFDSSQNKYGDKETVRIRYTKLKCTSLKKYIYQNFYGLRIANAPNSANNLVRATSHWDFFSENEITDRARTFTSNMLIEGDIILVYTGKTGPEDEQLENKSYIFMDNMLQRKIGSNNFEQLSGDELTVFLRNIVCDNYIVLRPSLNMDIEPQDQKAPEAFELKFELNEDGKTYTAIIPEIENGLYSFPIYMIMFV